MNFETLDQTLTEVAHSCNTIRDFVRFAVSIFNYYKLHHGHGTDNAYDEAVYLILHSLHLPLDQLEVYLDAVILKEEKQTILTMLKQRIRERIPAAYITQEALIRGYSFYVDKRTIIPRSYIAHAILNGDLDHYIGSTELVNNILDLCTGNASLAIIATHYFDNSHVIASDISVAALEVAKINVDRYGVSNAIQLIESNLFENLGQYKNYFDLILCNPPYVPQKLMESMPEEYKHEPSLSLHGGIDGFEIIKKIISNVAIYLNDGGFIVLEIGDNIDQLESLYPGLSFNWLPTKDNQGRIFILHKSDLLSYFNKAR